MSATEPLLPTLDSARLRLRPITHDDVDAIAAVFGDGALLEFWSSPPVDGEPGARALIESIHEHARRGTLFQWGIARREDDRLIGTCTLASIDRSNARAEIGFILARDHHGRGYAREAVARVLDHAFGDLELLRIEADVDPRNDRSLRLLAALGFRREGHLRERWRVGGKVADSLILGLLAREHRTSTAPAVEERTT